MTSSAWSLIVETARLFGRTTVLLYPILLFMLVMGFFKVPGQSVASILQTPLGLGLLVCVGLIMSAVLAGWSMMAYQAALAWCSLFFVPTLQYQPRFDQKALTTAAQTQPDTLTDAVSKKAASASLLAPLSGSFQLVKHFFDGIGQLFPQVALGVLIQTTVLLLVIALVSGLIASSGGIPTLMKAMVEVVQSPAMQADPAQAQATLQRMLLKAPVAQLVALEQYLGWWLLGLALYSTWATLTLLWLPILLAWRRSVVWCYWQSVCQFIRDPWRLGALLLWMTLLDAVLYGLSVLSQHPLLAAMMQFLWLMSLAYRLLLWMNYTLVVTGAPQLFSQLMPSTPSDLLDTQA